MVTHAEARRLAEPYGELIEFDASEGAAVKLWSLCLGLVIVLASCTAVTKIGSTPESFATATTWDEGESEFALGQSAHYTTDGDEIALEIAVQAPVSFKPSKDADVFEKDFATRQKGLQAETFYFTVTITNHSSKTFK